MEKNPWITLESKVIYENKWITLVEDQVLNPSGGKGIYGTVRFQNLAIGVIPLDDKLNTWLVGQWRYPLHEYSWEIPMGGGPIGLDPLESAKRELKEETGLEASEWTYLLKMHTSNSVTNEVGHTFVAKGLTEGKTEFEDTEDLKVWKLPFEEAFQMVKDNRITDSLSMVSILRLGGDLGF